MKRPAKLSATQNLAAKKTNAKWFTPKRLKKPLFIAFVVCSAALLLLMGINTYIVNTASRYIYSENNLPRTETYDAILVLGAMVYSEERLSLVLRDRVDCALRALDAGASDKLLFSGDHGQEDYDEVNACKHYALEHGVALKQIFLDHAGFSTYESMYRARDVFQIKRVLIVTQQFHLSRAVYIARSMGMDAYGVPADARRYSGARWYAVREFFARPKDFLFTHILQPLPKYLGDTIPISGSGILSQD